MNEYKYEITREAGALWSTSRDLNPDKKRRANLEKKKRQAWEEKEHARI